MPERLTEYRVMLHPSSELEKAVRKQLEKIAEDVYGKKTDDVIFRVKTVEKQTNPRKIFIPGNGDVVELEIFPHITLGQKIVINEGDEDKVLQQLKEIATSFKPFTLYSTELGDYGENFTIFLAFAQSKDADGLVSIINKKMEPFLGKKKERRDILHITLLYDDVDPDNIEKTWKIISKDGLINKKLPVVSLWLWKNKQGWKPYKEFNLKK